MADRGEAGDPGRKGDTGRTGDPGRTGDTGDTGRGPRGYPGAKGEAGVTSTLTITQLDLYVRRLEARYRKVTLYLTVALVAVAAGLLAAGAILTEQATDRVESNQAERRASIIRVCESNNAQNVALLVFLDRATAEMLPANRENFPIADCEAEARRGAP